MKKFFKRTVIAIFIIFVLVWFVSLFAPRHNQIDYGVTFSQPYAQNLGLDWKKVYEEMFTDLGVRRVRIPVYWNDIQPRPDYYDFEKLDYQIRMAEKYNAQVVLAVGYRVPRWPECFQPEWLKELSAASAADNALLSFIETTVNRYSNSPAITVWQVENEPFLSTFGICPEFKPDLLDKEIALVKKLDPARPVIITDSGELSMWFFAGKRGDIFGTTFYRYVYSDVLDRYWTNYIPALFYRFKAGLLRIMHPGKQIAIIELEAEPWTTKGITNTSIDEQFKTMSMDKFNTIIGIAKKTGFNPQYLWGVEWWYWMKQQNHPEFWDTAKQLFK